MQHEANGSPSKIHLNKTNVEAIEPPAQGERIYKDDQIKGFCLRVWSSGTKTYVVEGWVIDPIGKTSKVTIGKHGKVTAEQARKRAAYFLGQMAAGVDPNEKKRSDKKEQIKEAVLSKTLIEFWEDYKIVKRLAPSTIRDDSGILKRCFGDWQNKPLSKITADMVEERYIELSQQRGPRSNSEGPKAQTERAMRTLKAIYEYALFKHVDEDGRSILPSNPVKRALKLVRRDKPARRQTIIHDHQLEDWYKAVTAFENSDMRDLLLLLIFTGLRRGEATGLSWSEIDFQNRTLTIPASRAKNRKEHNLPLSDYLMQLLRKRQRANQGSYVPSIYVFPGDGASGHLEEPKRAVAFVVRESGVKFSCHDLRRTFITTSERLAIPYYIHKLMINHSQSNDVTSGYVCVNVDDMREPMQKITDRLKEKMGITEEKSIEAAITHS